MRERAVCLDPGLIGVACQPDQPRPDAPGFLFWNVGLNHRVGPSRGWVELARALAARGFASLRFDLSGFGDSLARRDTRSEAERALLDVRSAMGFLEAQRACQRFVLVANCSGVDSLHATVLGDERVVGAVSIDGYAYRNRGYRWRRILAKGLQPSRWLRRFRRWRLARAAVARSTRREPVWQRDLPTRERFASDLALLVARRVQLLFVFTSGVDNQYNHRTQFHDTFGHHSEAAVLFFPRADHLFSRLADRQALIAAVCAWVEARFPRAT